MIIYNLTKVSRGINYISEPLDILVWAMDDGEKSPVLVYAEIDGKQFPLRRIICASSEEDEIHSELPELILSPSKELSFNIEVKHETAVICKHNISYLLDGKELKTPSNISNYPPPISADESEYYAQSLPENLDSQYLYSTRLELSPGKKRVRIVAIGHDQKKHWVHGFWIKQIDEKLENSSKNAWLHAVWGLLELVYLKIWWLYDCLLKSIITRILKAEIFVDRWSLVTFINPERLGHFVANTEIYLAEKKCGLHPFPETEPVFFINRHAFVENYGWIDTKGKVANTALLELWKQKFKVIREGFISTRMVDQFRGAMPSVVHRHRPHGHRDIHGCLDRSAPSITLTEDQIRNGHEFLSAQGIPNDAKIVLFHYRTPEFVGSTYKNIGETLESDRYHYRNTNADSYELALDWLLSRGYYVIRMGKEKDVWNFKHPHAFDYASFRKGDWMDLYLFSRCEFFIGGTSGIYALAELFRKPILFTNFAPIGHVYSSSARYLTIFKALIDNSTPKPVSLKEQLTTDLGWIVHYEKLEKGRYLYRDNTAAEILDATIEMTLRLEGKWEENSEDAELQAKFWSYFSANEYHCHFAGRVGSKYLSQHASHLFN